MSNVIPIRSRDADLQHFWDEFLKTREAAWRPAASIEDGIAAGRAFGAFMAAVNQSDARRGRAR